MMKRDDNIQPPFQPEKHSALIIFCLLGMGCIVRSIISRFKIPISDKVVLISLGAAYAYMSMNESGMLAPHNSILNLSPKILLTIWIPIYIYKATYTLDTYLFSKNIHRILLLAVFSTLLSSSLLGLIVVPAINHGEWIVSQAFLFGAICAPINPFEVIVLLKDLFQSKELCCILESEFLIGNGTLIILFETIMRIMNGSLIELDEILLYILQIIFGELIYGYICGRIVSFFLHFVSKDIAICLGFTFSSIYSVFLSAKLFLDLPGYFSIFITVYMLNLDKNQLTSDLEIYITKFWELLLYISQTIVYIYAGSITVTKCNNCINFLDLAYITVTYVVTYAARFCSILIMAPIFSAWDQQWNWQSTLIAVWGGSKSGISLLMAAVYIEYEIDHSKPLCRFILTHITGLILLSILINGQTIKPILRISGLLDITRLKQINLNNSLKLIMEQQRDTIRVLKLHKFYADANWPIVKSTTFIRYTINDTKSDEDDIGLPMSRRSISSEMYKKEDCVESLYTEAKDLSTSIKLKMIHLRKQSYSRQLEYGKISLEAFKILSQSVFVALDKEDSQLEIELLRSLHKKKRLASYIIDQLVLLMEREAVTEIKIPRRSYRKICYKIVMSTKFQIFVYAILILDATEFLTRNSKISISLSLSMAANLLFFIIYLGEFILKILAHSYIYIWKHGLKFYFQSHWNKIEFIVLLMIAIETFFETLTYFEIQDMSRISSLSMKWILNLTSTSVFLRFIFKMVQGCKRLMPKFIQFFESRIDEDVSLAYDVGQGLMNAENEIIEVYSKSTDPGDFDIRIQAEKDRVAISNILSEIQKKRPWVPITVKTRQAVQTILSDMKKSTYELKNAGRLNDTEFKLIERKIEEQFEFMRKNIKRVEPCSPAEMFKEMPWLAGDEESALFLYSNVEQHSFKPGDFIAKFGEVSQGIYIIVTGLFKLTYEPDPNILEHLEAYGALPIVDYKSTYRFDERIDDYVSCGNTIGTIAILTNRPYSCSIVAEIPSMAYFIPIEKVQRAIIRTKNKIQSLDSKMWKDHSSSIAISLLSEVPVYEGTNLEEMKFLVERSFVPSVKNFEIFVVCDMIEDIILIYGFVKDFDTKEMFVAPCYIPRDVQKLVLKDYDEPTDYVIEPKLLVIPIKDAYDFEVMEKVEDLSIRITNEYTQSQLDSTLKFRKVTKNAMMMNRVRKSIIYGFQSQVFSDYASTHTDQIEAASRYHRQTSPNFVNILGNTKKKSF